MPSQNPATAGRKASCPRCSASSMAGISRLQTDAATMTPAAKPVRDLCTAGGSALRMTNTQAAPRTVPRKGSRIPCKVSNGIV